MKQTYILTQFVILMILFVGIMSTAVSLENNLSAEKGKKKAKKVVAKANPTVVAIAFIGCAGKSKCMAAKIKAQKCKLSKFSLKGATAAVQAFAKAAKAGKKGLKGMAKASGAFKKAMKPIATCNITPKKMKAAFTRGLKVRKGKKAKKAAKKAKKVVKKAKKAAKKAKKAAKKPKKAAKKAAYKAIAAALSALLKLC